MSGDNVVAPVIIKRKKVVGGDGHHGGAWKVAYADFVTAMMAFFLLMWLLNATTETQRKGIADYFTPAIPINRVSGGGDGAFGGDSVFSEEALPQIGTGATSLSPMQSRQAAGASGVLDAGGEQDRSKENLLKIEEALLGMGGESFVSDNAIKHIITKVTDEGLVIELFETPEDPLFDAYDNATPLFRELLSLIAEVLGSVENPLAIEGHVPSSPIVVANDLSWGVSTARAQAVRTWLSDLGVPEERMRRITGHADRKPSVDNPMDVRNSRVEVIFLRR
jgi:chemotaxis protein MotB